MSTFDKAVQTIREDNLMADLCGLEYAIQRHWKLVLATGDDALEKSILGCAGKLAEIMNKMTIAKGGTK